VLIARAEMLLKLGRAARGLELCQQAVALHPANGEAWLCLGLLRKALHQDNEALEAFDLAASLLSRPATALANRAIVLLELGRREDALLALDHAGKADPDHALTWFLRADTKIFLAGDPDVAAMERALFSGQGAPLCDADQIFLHYAVGKAWLDISDAERAFAHLNQGSRMKRASVNYDAGAAEQAMARIAAAFPAALFSRLGDAGEQSDVPVFIVGMPRSGTTLVEQILASHPRVHAAGEASHIEQLARELGGAWPDGVAALSPERIAELGRRYVAMAAPLGLGMARVTDKLPGNFQRAGLIHLLLPRARIIHCRRDAVDTCLSCYSKLFETGQDFSYDLTELGGYYRSYAALMAHWRAVLPAASFIETNYETIVHDLEGEARRLIAFCGLEWDDACLRFHLSRRVVRTSSKNQVRQPVYRHSVGRWMPFHDELGPLLEALSGPGTSFRET
jgi:tetratricopeptide (TPR) repeat protein